MDEWNSSTPERLPEMIRDSTPQACLQRYSELVYGYFAELQDAPLAKHVRAKYPQFSWKADSVEVTLPAGLSEYFELNSWGKVEECMLKHQGDGVVFPTRPALLLGSETITCVKDEDAKKDERFLLRSVRYKYVFLSLNTTTAVPPHEYYGMRLESDGGPRMNSWLLNHPLHHLQLGFDDDLRLPIPGRHTLLGIVDYLLRCLAAPAWGLMYPELHGALLGGVLHDPKTVTQPLEFARTVAQAGLESPPPHWYTDWKKWKQRLNAVTFLPDYEVA